MKEIPGKSIDMILCDLPFGQTQNKWDTVIPLDKLWCEYKRITKPSAAIVLFGQGMFTAELMMAQKEMWRYNYIWDKGSSTGFLNANKMPLREHEDILVFYEELPAYNPQFRTGPKTHCRGSLKKDTTTPNYGEHNLVQTNTSLGHAKHPTSILRFNKVPPSDVIHPTQKPTTLCEYLIKTYTNKGDIVLDNCIGSGTTAEACIRTGRQFIGFEKEQMYFVKAQERIKKAQEQGKLEEWF
jgi:site-specific DNA-methyltransferase (adenine-specific)